MSTLPSATNPTVPPAAPPNAGPPVNVESLVREALADVALVIASAAALHQLDDDLVWTVMKRLDRIRVRLLRELKGLAPREEYEPGGARPPRIHAAVDEFLVRNRAGMGE
ncbi:MAG TPA: hypothetical protein PLK67_15290 [Bryobacteraceae bacterium]|jgi:hypothetical protein|nr:hypothetical protein [Bryobacteraceae bacterium]